jgi:hypothetical protein
MLTTINLTPAPIVSGFGITLLAALICLRRREYLRGARIQSRIDRGLRGFLRDAPPAQEPKNRSAWRFRHRQTVSN